MRHALLVAFAQRAQKAQGRCIGAVIPPVAPAGIGEFIVQIAHALAASLATSAQTSFYIRRPCWRADQIVGIEMHRPHAALEKIGTVFHFRFGGNAWGGTGPTETGLQKSPQSAE